MRGVGDGGKQDTRTSDHKRRGESSQGHEPGPDGGPGEDRQHRSEEPPQSWVAVTRERGVGSDAGERHREDRGSQIGYCEAAHGGSAPPHGYGSARCRHAWLLSLSSTPVTAWVLSTSPGGPVCVDNPHTGPLRALEHALLADLSALRPVRSPDRTPSPGTRAHRSARNACPYAP